MCHHNRRDVGINLKWRAQAWNAGALGVKRSGIVEGAAAAQWLQISIATDSRTGGVAVEVIVCAEVSCLIARRGQRVAVTAIDICSSALIPGCLPKILGRESEGSCSQHSDSEQPHHRTRDIMSRYKTYVLI